MMSSQQTYQSYYTKSDHILDYMVGQLHISPGSSIMEPAGGDGVFIDKVLSDQHDVKIDVLELNPDAVAILKRKYNDCNNVSVKMTDTLLDDDIIKCHKKYDYIIGNPPYGSKQSRDIKNRLKVTYPNLYTKESYTLFLYACIRCLKEGGRLCFIIPDTFLSLHRHEGLRKFILLNTKIIELSLFPSSFFPGVNFGYAGLCIITLEKCSHVSENMKNLIKIHTHLKDASELSQFDTEAAIEINQGSVFDSVGSIFMLNTDNVLTNIINDTSIRRIGDVAACVTGFYSGNDKKYLHPLNKGVRNSKKYICAPDNEICQREICRSEAKNGISGTKCLIPIVKGGNTEYLKPTTWFMDWSEKALSEYKTSKKCRFQNPEYYFREGIAIPMVRSSKLTAALIENRLFDQSIVGVFPKDTVWIKYLLAFFNSTICTSLISAINTSTNNSANYIKKIPFIEPNKHLKTKVDTIVDEIINRLRQNPSENIDSLKSELDIIFADLYYKKSGIANRPRQVIKQPSITGLFDWQTP